MGNFTRNLNNYLTDYLLSMEPTSDPRIVFGCSLPMSLIVQLDQERGRVPRSQHIEQLLRKAMALEQGARSSPKDEEG